MSFPRLFAWLLAMAAPLMAAATTAAAAAAAPATKPSSTAPATTPAAVRAIAAKRTLALHTSGLLSFPNDDFYIALNERARQLGAERAGFGDRNVGDWFNTNLNGALLELSVDLTPDTSRPLATDQPPPMPPPVAAEIADALVEFTRDAVAREFANVREEATTRVERQFAEAQQQAKEAAVRLDAIRQRLRELSGRADVSSQTLTAALSSIDEEVQKLRLEKLAKESRRQALEEEIARASARIEKRVASDPIAAELQKVVEIREQSVQLMKRMHESGQVSQTELSDGIAKAAEARAKMLQQQRDAAAAAGGTSLEGFNKELMTLAIDSREQEAKLKHLEDRLPRLREAVEMLHEYRQIEQAAQEAREAVAQAERERRDLRRRIQDAGTPRVLLKESENRPPPAE